MNPTDLLLGLSKQGAETMSKILGKGVVSIAENKRLNEELL